MRFFKSLKTLGWMTIGTGYYSSLFSLNLKWEKEAARKEIQELQTLYPDKEIVYGKTGDFKRLGGGSSLSTIHRVGKYVAVDSAMLSSTSLPKGLDEHAQREIDKLMNIFPQETIIQGQSLSGTEWVAVCQPELTIARTPK